MRTLASIVTMVFTFLTLAPPLSAQTSHAASQSALDAALQEHVDSADADRGAILRLLDRAEVQTMAGESGLDLRRARSAVSTLSAQDLANLASQARQAEQSLAGGQSVTISTTMIIIALLVVILLVVAVD